MKAQIVPIGNSKGVRIPRALLELSHIRDVVDLQLKGHAILIKPMKSRPRAGWDMAFQAMHAQHDDRLLIEDRVDLDVASWEW